MDNHEIRMVAGATALPGPPIDNTRLARCFGVGENWAQWADTFVGTSIRHYAVDLETGETISTLADLGEQVGRQALARAELNPADVDLIVLGTATPDALMPATVNVIADRLGVDGVPSFQLQSGCAGAVQALVLARQMLRTGECRTALVIGGDVSVKHLDPTADISGATPAQLINMALFGDGAGAVVLSTVPGRGGPVLRRAFVRLTGKGRAPGQIVHWYGANRRADGPAASEDYKAIEERVPGMAVETLKELLTGLGWSEAQVTHLLPPQLSGRMTARIFKDLAMPHAREHSCVDRIGNTGNALLFFQLERLLPQMQHGDRALGIAIESSKWIKSGFALEKV